MNESRIEDLLDRWEELRELGEDVSVDELCSDDPELRSEVESSIIALQSVAWMDAAPLDDGQDVTRAGGRSFAPQQDAAVFDCEDLPQTSLTVDEFAAAIVQTGLMTETEILRFRRNGASEENGDNDAGDNPRSFARRMVSHGKLTRWQATVVLEQRSDPLLIDRYVVLDYLGVGGMGVVYKALHTSMDRLVALKLLPTHAVDSDDKVKRFQREARAAARLSHPNVVTMFDAAETEGTHFLAMEYVDGPDLARVVQQSGPLAVGRAVCLIRNAALGLQHAHEQGIVHRDVKPANLLLARDDTVKVADLGLATIEVTTAGDQFDQDLTGQGTFVGTVAYASPEQALESRSTDFRSDVYSLGATLFFLLTGRPPYQEDSGIKTLVAHREHPVPSLHDFRNDIPPELQTICERMLAKDPADRFASMAEVAAALHELNVANADAPVPTSRVITATSDTASVASAYQPTAVHTGHAPTTAASGAGSGFGRGTKLLAAAGGALVLLGIIIVVTDRFGNTATIKTSIGSPGSLSVNPTPPERARLVKLQDSGQRLGKNVASSHVALRDLDGDGELDAWVSNQRVPNMAWINDGKGRFTANGQELGESDSRRSELADFDDDGDVDVFVANYQGQPNRVWMNDGHGQFTDSGQLLGASRSRDVALRDFDGDGDIDAYVANKGEPNTVWFNDGHGVFSDSGQQLGDFDSRGLDAGDVDQDGDVDVFVACGGNDFHAEPNRVWLNDGTGTFKDSGQELGSNWSLNVSLGDLDQDGDLDAFVANTIGRPANTVWLNDGSGQFRDSGQKLGDFHSQNVTLIDFDRDGDLDACVSNIQSGLVWLNDGHALFDDSFYFGGGSSMATAIEDLNGDNFLDAFEAKVGYVPNRVLFGGRAGAITTDDDRNDEQPANVEAEVPGTDGSNDESSNRDANTGNIPEAARIPFDAAAAQSHQQAWASSLNTPVEHVNSVGVKLVLIPPGEFRMGFTDEQIESTMQFYDERSDGNGRDDLLTRIRPRLAPSQPQHTVVITNPFYFAVHPVTVGQFREFVDETAYETTAEADGKGGAFKSERNLQWNWNSPGFSQNDNHPVVQISRSDALAFCDWLGRRENRTYVLPTEAQWEFACRAGTETRWHYGEDRNEHWESYSLHSSGEQPETLPVGGKLPNAFGIFDLYGHPLELVADWWAPYSASRQIDPEFTTFSDRMVVRGNPYYGSAWRGYVDVSRLPGFDSTFRIATVLNQPE